MKLSLNKLIINNFLSIESETINLNNLGVVLVKGINNYDESSFKSNGSGKSAIFESILWAMTGSTSRGLDDVKNRNTKGELSVELYFSLGSSEYVIKRGSSKLIIIKDGADISGNTITKSKQILKEELSYINYDILTNLVLLSQGLPNKLSSLKAVDRKARLEYLSSIDILMNKIKDKVSNVYTFVSESISKVQGDIQANSSIINNNELTISNLLSKLNTSVISDEEYNIQSKEKDSILEELKLISSKVESSKSKRLELFKSHEDILRKCNSIKIDINDCIKEKERLDKEISSAKEENLCPTCHQLIDEDLKKSILEDRSSKLKEVESKYNLLEGQLKNISKEEESVNKELKEMSSLESDVISTYSSLNEKLSSINNQLAKYNAARDNKSNIEEIIKDLKSKISESELIIKDSSDKLSSLTKDLDITKYYKNALSRKFGNFLLDNTVRYINNRLKHYSKYLFSSEVVKLISEDSKLDLLLGEIKYEALSGGEQTRVNLITQLALRDLSVVESGFSCNLLVLDESLDYLDSSGVYNILRMLEVESSTIDTMMIVTHKEDISISADNIITIVKGKDRVSRIVNNQ